MTIQACHKPRRAMHLYFICVFSSSGNTWPRCCSTANASERRSLALVQSRQPAMSSSQNWEVRFSNSRQLPYFYDRATNTSVWEKPDSISEEEVASLPGAHYLGGATGQAAEPAQVRASHLLVKHRNSRRPSSWKEVRPSLLPLPFAVSLTRDEPEQHHPLARGSRSDPTRARKGAGTEPFGSRLCSARKGALVSPRLVPLCKSPLRTHRWTDSWAQQRLLVCAKGRRPRLLCKGSDAKGL